MSGPEPQSTSLEKSLDASPSVPATPPPFTIFTQREKWIVVSLASFGSLFSPLTANIYFPAIPVMAEQFHKSTEQINLTVTVYMVFQGLAPMLWGTLADRLGRRPIFIACTVLLSLSCVGLALCPTDAYWLLMLLRCIQAAGSASTVALAAGVMGDVTTRAERGTFVGLLLLAPSVGPTIGPIIGGGLTQGLGWRSLFWFLCIGSALCAFILLLFLPETLRTIVGNGSVRPSQLYRPLIPLLPRNLSPNLAGVPVSAPSPPKRLINPFRILIMPDIFLQLMIIGIANATFYAVLASLSSLFSDVYPFLNQTDIGLCFLSIGGGQIIASIASGKLIDWVYRRFHTRWLQKTAAARAESGDGSSEDTIAVDEHKFPVERARLYLLPFFVVPYVICNIGYGWCLQQRVNISVPLILQFIIGFCFASVFNIIQALIVDAFPSQGSSITACNNIVRCSLGAVMVGVFDIISRALGFGWTYVLLGGIAALMLPLALIVTRYGPQWRENRRHRMEGDK